MGSSGSAGQKQGAAGDEARQGARQETIHGRETRDAEEGRECVRVYACVRA